MSDKHGAPFAGLRLLTNPDDVLATDDIVREPVPTPEWGEGTGVLVQSMTANQRFAFMQAQYTVKTDSRGKVEVDRHEDLNTNVLLVVCSVVNEQGEPVFSRDHVERLAQKNSAPIERIATVARRLSRLRAEDQEVLGENLKATTNGVSRSA